MLSPSKFYAQDCHSLKLKRNHQNQKTNLQWVTNDAIPIFSTAPNIKFVQKILSTEHLKLANIEKHYPRTTMDQ